MHKRVFRFAAVGIIAILALCPIEAAENHTSLPDGVEVSFNGVFVPKMDVPESKVCSGNGRFWCDYTIGWAGDEMRELVDFRLYDHDRLLYTLDKAPGSDVYISNSGIAAFLDHSRHFDRELTVHLYSRSGQLLGTRIFQGAFLFGFSHGGNMFGVGTPEGLTVTTALDGTIRQYERGSQFDISENEDMVAVAAEGHISVYSHGEKLRDLDTRFQYTRKIKISPDNSIVAAIDKRNLKVFSIHDGSLLFSDTTTGNLSFRDLIIKDEMVFAGVHYKDKQISKGILRSYDLSENKVFEREESAKSLPNPRKWEPPSRLKSREEPIPWMFAPFDSMRTVWNYYEQHMGDGSSDWSYLHQGLDLIVPVGEPTYAVQSGVVKCVLTIGGASYWRLAISPEQSAGWSDGWLYAHLIHSTIQVDVGDTVDIHDYLGNIVQWTEDWGHIHFVQIHDSGLVWLYDDNEWGINFNPLLALEPDSDLVAPVIENVFPDSKFAFCTNETSHYLDSDSLYGDVDIIIKTVDYVGESEWQQPAFYSYYWVNRLPEDTTVFPRTLGYILNHRYPFYEVSHFEPYATVLYKRDQLLPGPEWMMPIRNYYHILTNNNGDSLIELSEANLAFATADYPDGEYRIFIQAFDEYGNSATDSMDVRFHNDNPVPPGDEAQTPVKFRLAQNYPNPFNPTTTIHYTIPASDRVTLTVYDILGRKIQTLVDRYQRPGEYQLVFEGGRLASGIYFCQLKEGKYTEIKKMLLVR
jgi:hypothetical protein